MEEQKKSIFKKFLIIYVIILAALMVVFLGYVADSLIKYEKNQIENYMESTIKELKKASKNNKIERYIDISNLNISEFEKESTSIGEGFYELFETQNITYKLKNGSTNVEYPIYDIFANDKQILEIKLNGAQKENRLGLLTFNKWKTETIEIKAEKDCSEKQLEELARTALQQINDRLYSTEMQALGFAIQELALYLDTHRDDSEALELYRSYQQMYMKCSQKWGNHHGPLNHHTASDSKRYNWLDDPWPWEYCANKEV